MRGPVSPVDFIPLAEECGLIDAIGDWVLLTACLQAVRWAEQGMPLAVAVNLSPLQLRSASLTQRVFDTLKQTGLARDRLELEVTEGALMENTALALRSLQVLHEGSIRLALDDFGTGYSSLAYLARMPIDHIKIDRCFVKDLRTRAEGRAIIHAVLAIGRSLGMSVTAEGVETPEQALTLHDLGCHTLQGYHFSRPVAPEAIPALWSRRWPMASASTGIQTLAALAARKPPARPILAAVSEAASP